MVFEEWTPQIHVFLSPDRRHFTSQFTMPDFAKDIKGETNIPVFAVGNFSFCISFSSLKLSFSHRIHLNQNLAKNILTFKNIPIFMKGQLKKLVFDKRFIDAPGGEASSEWRLSPWKIFACLIAGFIALIILYAFLATPEPSNFLGNVLFYAIVIVGAIAILWIAGTGVYKGRKIIAGFFIAFILIITFYWFLGFLLGHFNILSFHMGGWALWFMITILAGMGSRKINGELDRSDVFYGILVFLICIGSNIPVANGQGFLWNLDNLIIQALGWGSLLTNNLGIILW